MKINSRITPVVISVMFVMIADLFNTLLPSFFSYMDEMIVLVAFVFIIFHIFSCKSNGMLGVCLFLIFIIGISSNFLFKVNDSFINVILDCFTFFKPLLIIQFIIMFKDYFHWDIINKKIMKMSKIMIIVLSISSIISLFTFKNMTDADGYFCFFSPYNGMVGFWCVTFLAVLYANMDKQFIKYYILTLIPIIRTGSGLALLSAMLMIVMYIFIGKGKEFKWYYWIFIIPAALYVSREEINGYLLNKNAPRALMIKYSFTTANKYFPLGSGFGTFGSRVAADSYSKLYDLYGFGNIWGLSKAYHPYLLDNYYPQIIGQIGYVGIVIFILIMLYVMKKEILQSTNLWKKYAALYLLICWLIAGLGFNNTGSWGTITLGLVPVIAFSNSRK